MHSQRYIIILKRVEGIKFNYHSRTVIQTLLFLYFILWFLNSLPEGKIDLTISSEAKSLASFFLLSSFSSSLCRVRFKILFNLQNPVIREIGLENVEEKRRFQQSSTSNILFSKCVLFQLHFFTPTIKVLLCQFPRWRLNTMTGGFLVTNNLITLQIIWQPNLTFC